MVKDRILLVDDDQNFLEVLAARCRGLGLEVETASNTLTAITIIGVRPPDMICLDIEMPTGNGLSVREFLANDPAYSGKPTIMLTGRKDEGTVRRCAELNAYYIHKSPNYWKEVVAYIRRHLDVQEVEPELETAQ